jgi:hypothetical protein
MQQQAVALTVTGQTGACHRCQTGASQGSPTSSKQGKEATFSNNKT